MIDYEEVQNARNVADELYKRNSDEQSVIEMAKNQADLVELAKKTSNVVLRCFGDEKSEDGCYEFTFFVGKTYIHAGYVMISGIYVKGNAVPYYEAHSYNFVSIEYVNGKLQNGVTYNIVNEDNRDDYELTEILLQIKNCGVVITQLEK